MSKKHHIYPVLLFLFLCLFLSGCTPQKTQTPENEVKQEKIQNANRENEVTQVNLIENTENTSPTYEPEKTSTQTKEKETKEKETKEETKKEEKKPEYKEEEIASFSTKIYSKDDARQNNIRITCSKLNNTEVKAGKSFSFCSTVGRATSSKGYKEADMFDSNGQKKKGLGGGNCQVSTTLYNAVLKVSDIKVTERHEHSNDVPYIKDGKDAAVAYGSYDFKFKNQTNDTIKIKSSTSEKKVSIQLLKIVKK